MHLREELKIGKPLDMGQELALAVLLTREYIARLLDERLFKPEGITDQQYNLLRILKGGPVEGYLIRDIRGRMVVRNADVPRLVERMAASGLVHRQTDDLDRRGCRVRITKKGAELEARLGEPQRALGAALTAILAPEDCAALLQLLEQLRDGVRDLTDPVPSAPPEGD